MQKNKSETTHFKEKRQAPVRLALKNTKTILLLVIVVAVAVNIGCFCYAFPETFKPESPIYARDFSAYYIGEWRLFHNPTAIYSGLNWPGDYPIYPNPQTFKYTPSALILFAPILTLSYDDALLAFNLLQVALVPAMAYFVYKLTKDKNLSLAALVAVILLVQPLPTPPLNQPANDLLHSQFTTFYPQAFTPTYFVGYVVVNAHVLQTIILVAAIYFAFAKKPWVSALLFSIGVFDPRPALLAVPLLLWYNRQKLRQFIGGTALFLTVTNLPFFFYQDIGWTFLRTEVDGSIISQMYPYDWLPIYAVVVLTILEILTWEKTKGAVKNTLGQIK
jgi:hypothetical protein